jgi:hypothetical protein
MTFNKWTVALATAGVVSLASVVNAEERTSSVLTSLSPTTLSGYVDTSAQWNLGTGNDNMPPYKFGGADKADGFNLNVVQLRIEKPLDEAEWSAGYRVDLWAGPDANSLGTQSILADGVSDFAVRQAYVAMRMPVANGIDLKMGVFDSIIGYESVESPNNPNYTRSYGHSLEPQTHTGLLASYRFNDLITASVGVANTVDPVINSKAQFGSQGWVSGPFASLWNQLFDEAGVTASDFAGSNAKAESYKTYMGSLAITAPDSMGFLAGSTLYGGIVNGFNGSVWGSGTGENQTSYYLGGTVATPVTGLRAGAAFDYLDPRNARISTGAGELTLDSRAWALAGYLTFQATEKLSFHGRLEWLDAKVTHDIDGIGGTDRAKILGATATAQYDLWDNVISRLEFRWDHSLSGAEMFGKTDENGPTLKNAVMIAANIIYRF